MKKNIIIIISLIIVIGVMSLGLIFMKTDNPKLNYTEDELAFKDEYEILNGTEVAENYVLKTVNIDSDNNVKYVSDDEILDLLTNGTNVIYFGWADCNWCRSVVPTLINVLKENDINTLNYYDFKKLRTAYENSNDTKKIEIYEKILDIIGEDITSVFAEDSLRNGEKKILAPTVVFIKDGKYIGLHFKSVDSQINSTDDLNETQIKELKNKYQILIDQLENNVCSTDEGC